MSAASKQRNAAHLGQAGDDFYDHDHPFPHDTEKKKGNIFSKMRTKNQTQFSTTIPEDFDERNLSVPMRKSIKLQPLKKSDMAIQM